MSKPLLKFCVILFILNSYPTYHQFQGAESLVIPPRCCKPHVPHVSAELFYDFNLSNSSESEVVRQEEPGKENNIAPWPISILMPNLIRIMCPNLVLMQALFHELVYDGINTEVMHASRTQVRYRPDKQEWSLQDTISTPCSVVLKIVNSRCYLNQPH